MDIEKLPQKPQVTCPHCKGSGKLPNGSVCPPCKGIGKVPG